MGLGRGRGAGDADSVSGCASSVHVHPRGEERPTLSLSHPPSPAGVPVHPRCAGAVNVRRHIRARVEASHRRVRSWAAASSRPLGPGLVGLPSSARVAAGDRAVDVGVAVAYDHGVVADGQVRVPVPAHSRDCAWAAVRFGGLMSMATWCRRGWPAHRAGVRRRGVRWSSRSVRLRGRGRVGRVATRERRRGLAGPTGSWSTPTSSGTEPSQRSTSSGSKSPSTATTPKVTPDFPQPRHLDHHRRDARTRIA